MSISRWRASDLVGAYGSTLEQQIVEQGSSLACWDGELFAQVEELLGDRDAAETHCLGLDPLPVMEESLKASATDAGRPRAKGGLRGLAKAFEVVEQAALNLYLGPWRKEYKFVKMYSGTFTHFIKPVLSTPQIEKLFGLLGYQLSSRHEQLRLQPPRLGPASLGDLLRLSCAFFLARCECRLLLAALGKRGGDAQWELGVVRERQKGNSIQVALDNTKKKLEVSQPLFEGEEEMDLYTDEQINGGQRVRKEEGPRPTRAPSAAAAKTHSNGATSPPSAPRDDVHVSTLNCQLTKMPPLEQDAAGAACVKDGKLPCEESAFAKEDPPPPAEPQGRRPGAAAAANDFCSCLQSSDVSLQLCTHCNTLHTFSCALLQNCILQMHAIMSPDAPPKPTAAFSQGGSRAAAAAAAGASPPSVACDDPMGQAVKAMAYHYCCGPAQLDPQVLCLDCEVFHARPCRAADACQAQHSVRALGVCSCGRPCSRKPLVLCRYCGKEYCRECWYRNPVACSCGQTFDQSHV